MSWVEAALLKDVWILNILFLGVSVLSVCHTASFSQSLSPNTSVTPWATTLQCRSPKISCLELWTPMTESPEMFSYKHPCAAGPHSPAGSQLHTLVVMAGGWGCQWQLRLRSYAPWNSCHRHFCAPQLRVLSIQIWRADTQNMHLPMCERSQAALCGRMRRMNPPYPPPFQVCFPQEHFFPPLLDLP